mmetsp:Transcript_27920/g.32045  ORF Transcript_27920/g.32045 Transcript_27920/m.32045 type:complete len:303 (-) Transcript_27920:7-915(-)
MRAGDLYKKFRKHALHPEIDLARAGEGFSRGHGIYNTDAIIAKPHRSQIDEQSEAHKRGKYKEDLVEKFNQHGLKIVTSHEEAAEAEETQEDVVTNQLSQIKLSQQHKQGQGSCLPNGQEIDFTFRKKLEKRHPTINPEEFLNELKDVKIDLEGNLAKTHNGRVKKIIREYTTKPEILDHEIPEEVDKVVKEFHNKTIELLRHFYRQQPVTDLQKFDKLKRLREVLDKVEEEITVIQEEMTKEDSIKRFAYLLKPSLDTIHTAREHYTKKTRFFRSPAVDHPMKDHSTPGLVSSGWTMEFQG